MGSSTMGTMGSSTMGSLQYNCSKVQWGAVQPRLVEQARVCLLAGGLLAVLQRAAAVAADGGGGHAKDCLAAAALGVRFTIGRPKLSIGRPIYGGQICI